MAVTKEEVLRVAVQLEKDGRDFYLDASAKTGSDLARKMFQSLADDESNHIEWIERMAPGVETAEVANRQLYNKLRPIFANAPAGLKLAAEFSSDDIKALDIAIGMEVKSMAAYSKWAEEADSDDICNLCKVLVGQERFHKEMLENTKKYLDSTADWFMQEEGWNFEGA